jgi:hypothetical protein
VQPGWLWPANLQEAAASMTHSKFTSLSWYSLYLADTLEAE